VQAKEYEKKSVLLYDESSKILGRRAKKGLTSREINKEAAKGRAEERKKKAEKKYINERGRGKAGTYEDNCISLGTYGKARTTPGKGRKGCWTPASAGC